MLHIGGYIVLIIITIVSVFGRAGTIADLERELESALTRSRDIEQRLINTQATAEQLRGQLEHAEGELQRSSLLIGDLRNINTDLTDTVNRIRVENRALRDSVAQLRTTLARLEQEVERAQSDLRRVGDGLSTVEADAESIGNTTDRIISGGSTLDSLLREIESASTNPPE
jgi:chromosome segregation ATPase